MRCSKYQIIWYWWTVYSQIWKRTNRNCIIFNEFLFPFLSHLSSFSVKSLPLFFLKLRSYPLSTSLIFSSLTLVALPLSLTKPTHHCFSSYSFFFFLLWFDGWVGQWVGWDSDVWVQMVLVGFGSDGGGWVRMGGWVVDGLGCRWIRLS